MASIVSEITDAHGKKHYVGRNSNAEIHARSKGFTIRMVHVSGHHIPSTVNGLIHHKGHLHDGPILIDGKTVDPNTVATVSEHRYFLNDLFGIAQPETAALPTAKVA